MKSYNVIPDVTVVDDPEFDMVKKHSNYWKYGSRDRRWLNQFWICWKNDSTERGKKNSLNYEIGIPKVGKVVLIKDKLPRGQWRVGKISELIKETDQQVRSTKVIVAPHRVLH